MANFPYSYTPHFSNAEGGYFFLGFFFFYLYGQIIDSDIQYN